MDSEAINSPTQTNPNPTQVAETPKKCKHMPIIIILAVLAALGIGFGGFELWQNMYATTWFTFPKNIINMFGKTTEEFKEELSESEDAYEDIVLSDDGSVKIKLKESQIDAWKKRRMDILGKISSAMSELNDNYSLTYNSNCTKVDVYYDNAANYDVKTIGLVMNYTVYANAMCGAYQIFDGVPSDDWSVTVSAYNSETGKLVGRAISPYEELTLNDDDWNNSSDESSESGE